MPKVNVPDSIKPKMHLGVDWYLPGYKRPFATTTPATNDLVVAIAYHYPFLPVCDCAKDDGVFRYEPDARALMDCFIQAGYGHYALSYVLSKDFMERG